MREGTERDALLAEARRRDPDRTLCVLLAPPAVRDELVALLLLNQELARVAETVRQPLAGAIRLRFWRDRLAAVAAGGPADHAILRALAPALVEGRLGLAALEQLVSAREAELEGLLEPGTSAPGPPPSLETLEAHARATSGGLARAMAELLAAREALAAAAEAAGTAYGLVGLVRATPFEAARERRILARSLVDAVDPSGTSPGLEAVPRGDRAALVGLAEQLLGRAEAWIQAVRRVARGAERAQLAPLLLATLAEVQLQALRKMGCDPFRAEPIVAPTLPLRLLLAWLRRRP